MEGIFFVLMLAAGVVFVLPIVALVQASTAAKRARQLEERLLALELQHTALGAELARTRGQLQRLTYAKKTAEVADAAPVSVEAAPSALSVETAPSALSVETAPPALSAEGALTSAEGAPTSTEGAPTSAENAAEPASVESGSAESATAPTPGVQASPVAPIPVEPPRDAPPPSTPSAPEAFDWERWIGVRGAAVLGGIVLALAGVMFFRYAIDHSLLSPSLRVVLGTLLGVACLVLGDRLRERYGITANALAGGGMVVLYATFWAARALYHLIGVELAFGLMALTTAVGCLLAIRAASLLIAVLGLVGGFLTPLLLSSGQDRPLGLFGYVLLLDAGFILAARKRGWGVVMGLALAGTLLLEGLWITQRMGSERTGLGLGIVAVFVALFVVAGSKPPAGPRATWLLNQAAALLLPFGFALYFASQAKLGSHLWPLSLLLGMLVLGAGFVARGNDALNWLPLASAVGGTTVVGVWLASASLTPALAWEAVLCALALAGIFQLLTEFERPSSEIGPSSRAAAVAEIGLFVCLIVAASAGPVARVESWLTGFIGLGVLLLVHGRLPGRAALTPAAAALLAFGLSAFQRGQADSGGLPDVSAYFALEVGLALGFQVVSLFGARLERHLAAALFPALILLGVLWQKTPLSFDSPAEALGPTLALGALSLFASTRSKDGRWFPPAALVLVVAQDAALSGMQLDANGARLALAIAFGSALFCTIWPTLVRRGLEHPQWALYVSALAGPAWFLSLRSLYLTAFGAGTIGVLPVVLGASSLAVLASWARFSAPASELRRSALVWHAAVALGFASVAIPLQLDKQWITIGWALEVAALLFLYRRLDHAGLKWLALALALAVSVRLLVNPSVLEYEARGSVPFLNWLLYTYWVPALSLFAGYSLLKDIELGRVRSWEQGVYRSGHALGSIGLLLAVIGVVFAWLNLAIVDAFSEGTRLVLDLERRPARDLSISLSWVAYAGALLAIGMVKGSRGLRWLSLVFMILSIGKVFLYDLGQLRDLYRVLSLLGLAFSLICVSLAYQRFVFGKKGAPRSS